mgnify:CR=1 FL=1
MTTNTSDNETREKLSKEQIADLRQQVSLFLDEDVYPVENIFQAEIVDGRLHGYTTDLDDAGRLEVYVEYCLGKGIKDHQAREYARANPEGTIGKTDHKKSPTIYGMVFDEDGTTRVETKKKVYRVEYKSWKNLPSNYPSNTEGDWWEEK